MSIYRCPECERMIDDDYDFGEPTFKHPDDLVCESCRNNELDELERELEDMKNGKS